MPPDHKKGEKHVDPRDAPAYPLVEAARYLKLPAATLRSWLVGRPYPKAAGVESRNHVEEAIDDVGDVVVLQDPEEEQVPSILRIEVPGPKGPVEQFHPLIRPPSRRPPVLSFWNLIEAHVLRSLRTVHGVSLRDLRKALAYAERSLHIKRLLLNKKLRTEAGHVFLDQYGRLIDLSASGQLAMRKVFDEHLKRVEWGEWPFPIRLYPFLSSSSEGSARPIAIDPKIAFGRPIVVRTGISTQAIAERIDAGETVSELAADYGLDPSEIEEAVVYERAA